MQKSKVKFQEYQFAPTKEEAFIKAERAINQFINKNLVKKKDGSFMTPDEIVIHIQNLQSAMGSSSSSSSGERAGLQYTFSTMSIIKDNPTFQHLKDGATGHRTSGSLVNNNSSPHTSVSGHSNSISAGSGNSKISLTSSTSQIQVQGFGSNGGGGAGTINNSSSSTNTPTSSSSNDNNISIDAEFQMSYTQLVTLPPQIYSLIWLQKLVLTHHNIKKLDEDISKLQQLQVLILENNRLTSLPNAIGDLINLKRLEADNNHLVQLCSLEKLSKLEVLSVANNKLTLLPTSIASLPSLKTLNIKQNPIITPPSTVISKGLKDIVAFLRELETGARPCLRSKIIVLGDSGVGKSSVVTAIRGGKSSSSSKKRSAAAAAASGDVAPGIEIDQYEFDAVFDEDDKKRRTITVSTWDITNNDVYQATNQLFASERSVHVIVWDISKTLDEANLEYWLHCVTSVAPTSPIILVGTHIDAYEDTSRVNLILEQAAARFQKTFQTIQAIISVSCTTGYDVDRLRSVTEDIVKQQKYLKEKVPSSFFTLEEALIEVRKKRIPPIMMWNEYIALANICNPKDTVQIQRATEFLHNIGSIVYFNDPNSTVGKMIILDVQWIINCITALITAKLTKNGIIRTSELAAIWKSPAYPEHLQGALLAIMQAFEITYPLSPGDLIKSDDLMDPFASSASLGGAHHLNTNSTSSLSTLVSSINSTSTMSLASVMTTGSSIIGISPNTNVAGAANDRHLVPNLLAETGNIVSQWEDFNDPDVIRLNRQYHLPFIPDKFFGKLIIRLIHFVKVESCLKRAVIVKNAAGHEALIELKTNTRDQSRKRVLTVDVRGLPTPVGLLRIVTDTIESLLSQWYKLDIKRCISCYECTFLFDPTPTLFTIEDCELAVMDGKTVLNCFKKADEHEERTTHRLKLDILAPDIAMLDIPRPRFELKEVKLLKEVGRGAFGVVYEAEWNGEIVALKKLIPRTIDDQNSTDISADEQKEDRLKVFREFRHEVYMMSRLSHPNIMKISGFCIQPLCMALEYVKYGSLYSLLSNPSIEVSWGLRLQIASEIAKGMQHLHSHNPSVIHRDLKSPNILMHATVEGPAPASTIIDYGTSTALYGGAALARCVDQPLWLAPEVMASQAYSEPSDVYAFGIILWELYTRSHPFDEYQFGQWMSKLEDEIIRGLRPTIPASCPPEYAELIQSCWTHEPNSRPTFTSIVETLTNLKKKFAPLQSSLPPHIRLATRKSRSSSFSESMLTGSIASSLNLSVSGTSKDTNSPPSITPTSSTSTTPNTLSTSATSNTLVQSGQHPGQLALQQQQTFANTSSSSLSSAAAGGSLHHSPSSSDLIEDVVSDEDLHSLDIFTEEELEQPYPFCDDDQQRGILFGFDEEQSSSNSIVVAATLAKMIELMTRSEPIPNSVLSQASSALANIPAPGSMYSRSETQSSLNLSTTSSSSLSSNMSTGATGRKRSDTAGKNLPMPSFGSSSSSSSSNQPSGNQPGTSWRNSIPSLSVQGGASTLDENFIDDFLSVYRSFTTPVKVFKILVRRFFGPRPNKSDAYTLRKFEQRRTQIRSGVSSFIKRWCSDITELEYKQDACWLYHKVFEFTNVCLVNDPPVANSIIGILASYENISKTLIEMELRIKNGGEGLPPLHPSSATSTPPTLGGLASQNISKTFLNLAIGIRDPLYGVPVREKKYKNKLWVKCFTGADCIDWLMKITFLPSREDAKTVAMDLHTRQFIYLLSDDGSVVADLKGGNKIEFYDSQTQYYTFLDDDTELVAQQYTFLELKFLQDIHPRELLGFSVGLATNDTGMSSLEIEQWKQANFPHIYQYLKWFNKMSMLVASEIVKQRDVRFRGDMIERYIKIALEYLSLWNFNGVMQILSALHSEPIARLANSWARVNPKYMDCFIDLSRLMLCESNYQPLRIILHQNPTAITSSNYPALAPHMARSNCPTIPFLGALIADLSQTSTENQTFISSNGEKMTNILRMRRLSKKMKMFKQYKEMPMNYRPPLSSTPLSWYQAYMTETRAFDYNQIDRLSEIERKIELEAEKSGTSQTSDDRDEREARHTDSLGFGNEELTERDWSLLLTSATVITYHRGDVVIEENTINSYLYRIKSGVLGVEKKKDGKSVKVSTMNAPKMFGEMSFLGNKTTARVVVDETADLYVMDIPFLNNLFVSHPRLGAKFYKIMANQLATRLKNLPWSKPQTAPSVPQLPNSSNTPPSTPPSISPLVSALAGNSGNAGSFGSMGGGPGSSSFLQPFAKEAVPPPPLIVPSIPLDRVINNTSTPPASPRTPVAPNPFLANVHPHLQHRTNTVSNFNISGLGSGGSGSGGGPLSHILTPRGRDEGVRSGSVSRTPTQANLKYSSSGSGSDKSSDKDKVQNEEKKTDQEFNQRFSLDEIVIKDYSCSLNRSGRLYISQGHVCFYSKFFGYKTKKVIPFKQIEKLMCGNTTFLELSRTKNTSQRNYRFTFASTKDRQDAYGIISSLCESAKLATTSTADDLKMKLREERKKQNATLKPKNKSTTDQLTKEDWELIGREGSRYTLYKKDEPIVKQGDRIQKIFQIGKGVCRIEKTVSVTQHNPHNPHHSSEVKTVVLGTMKQDETFGEITFLLSGEVTATVVADTNDVEIYAIEGQFVNILFDLNPSLATRWFKYLATALNKTLIERESQLYN